MKQENSSDEEYLQYCDTCQGYKAPRSHHCRKCKLCILDLMTFIELHKPYLICIHCFIINLTNWYFLLGGHCIMKMDHHCPWINNCVGHFNHGHFVGFLFFAVLGCAQATVILAMTLYYGLNRVRTLSHILFCWAMRGISMFWSIQTISYTIFDLNFLVVVSVLWFRSRAWRYTHNLELTNSNVCPWTGNRRSPRRRCLIIFSGNDINHKECG